MFPVKKKKIQLIKILAKEKSVKKMNFLINFQGFSGFYVPSISLRNVKNYP